MSTATAIPATTSQPKPMGAGSHAGTVPGAHLNTDPGLRRLRELEARNSRGGRPPIVLPAPVARMILDEYADGTGYSLCQIVRHWYRYYGFSRRWLARKLDDGRLRAMADGWTPDKIQMGKQQEVS